MGLRFHCSLEGATELQSHWDAELHATDDALLDVGLEAARTGVEAEQAEHPYTDRTGNLTGNAHVEQTTDREAEMVWPEEYASFVDKGTSTNKPYPFTPIAGQRAETTLARGTDVAVAVLIDSMEH